MELGQLFVDEGLVTSKQLGLAKSEQADDRIDQTLIKMGLVTEDAVLKLLANEFGMEYIDLKDVEVDVELLTKFPTSAIYRHSLLPLYRQNGHVVVATDDPLNLEGIDELGDGQRPASRTRPDSTQ